MPKTSPTSWVPARTQFLVTQPRVGVPSTMASFTDWEALPEGEVLDEVSRWDVIVRIQILDGAPS